MAEEQQTIGNAQGIRGPEIHLPDVIAGHIAGQDRVALSRYAQGMIAVIRAWKLLAAVRRLETLRTERAFLIHQLEILEARSHQAVAAALTRHKRAHAPATAPDERDDVELLRDELNGV